MEAMGYPFHFVVTATTRPRRPNEVDGVDYHFVSEGEFMEMLEQDELLEHAMVYGQHKGIPKKQVREALKSGKDVIMRLDVQGAATIRRLVPEAVLIFLTAPPEELIRRLRKRETETLAGLERRTATALEELTRLDEFDYVVVNRENQLCATVRTIAAIITAEKCRVKQRRIELQGGAR
jgi:guanylate kinase